MQVTNYIQKIDLRRTFTEFNIRVKMSGSYARKVYNNHSILNLKYNLDRPVDLYVSYDEQGNIVDGYLYLEKENFITSIIQQAIEDASYDGTSKKKLKHKKEAIDWFMNNDPQFMQYCKILGIDSNTIRNKIVKNVPMTRTKQQKEIYARL